jgi:hypothetical protein
MKSPFMLRKLLVIFLAISVGLTSVSCGSNNETKTNPSNPSVLSTKNVGTKLADGKYEVQQATYNDANGEYAVMLLNTPVGSPPLFRNTNLQMARLTEEEVATKEKAYLKIENGQAAMHIPEDFKIEYARSVTQEQTNPQTGQRETVVRREGGGFWAPFAGSVAGSLCTTCISTWWRHYERLRRLWWHLRPSSGQLSPTLQPRASSSQKSDYCAQHWPPQQWWWLWQQSNHQATGTH